MKTDLDVLLTALHVLIDDHVIPSGRRRPGHTKKLSDADLVCLAVARVLLAARSEHHWLRMCYGWLGHLFPYLAHQHGYHKRVTAAAPLISKTTFYLATLCPSWAGDLRLIDATPVPCSTSRQMVQRSELAGWRNYGYWATHSRWCWGLKLYVITTAEGMPATWCLADPKLGEREVAAELPRHAHDIGAPRDLMIVPGDKALARREPERYAADQVKVLLARPDRTDEERRFRNLAGMRQSIEAIFNTLKGQLSPVRHGGRTPERVYTRIAQRLLALAAAIWPNWRADAPDKRSLIAYDH